MSSRLAGAVLALIAAALLALSIVTSAWWSGHPEVEGRTIDAKTVFVGLHGAHGCNTGGDGKCSTLELPDAFIVTGYVELGAAGLSALAALALALLTLAGSDRRKGLATALFALAGLSVVIAIALIVQGPKIKTSQHVTVPMGYGMFVFFGGVAAGVLGAIIARRPFPKLQPRPSRAAAAPGLAPPPAAGQQPVDVLALLRDDAPRPAQPQPQPPAARPAVDPFAQTQALPGPAGPLAPPLFHAAPQLRPLYETAPTVGGTSGYVAGAPAALPPQGPAPVPRAQVSAYAGIPTPPPINEPRPKPASAAPPTAIPLPPIAPPKPATIPPPIAKPVTIPPPRSQPPAAPAAPPTVGRSRPGTVPPPGAIAARLKASSVPPPVRPASQGAAPPPEVPAAVPTTPKTLAGAAIPAKPASPMLPVRAETDPADHLETVEREKDSDPTGDPTGDPTNETAAAPGEVGDATDTSAAPAPEAEATALAEPLDTEQGPAVRPDSESDHAETNMVEKQEPAEIVAVAAAEPAPAAPEAPKIPISTAPDSLPPPKQATTTTGPTPACPQCEAPMAWVEEHLRFYCKSCRMYF